MAKVNINAKKIENDDLRIEHWYYCKDKDCNDKIVVYVNDEEEAIMFAKSIYIQGCSNEFNDIIGFLEYYYVDFVDITESLDVVLNFRYKK